MDDHRWVWVKIQALSYDRFWYLIIGLPNFGPEMQSDMFQNLLYQHTTGSHWQPTTIHLRHPGLRTEGGELRQEKHVIAQRHQSHFVQNSIHLAVVETGGSGETGFTAWQAMDVIHESTGISESRKSVGKLIIFGTTKHRSKTYKNIYALPCCGNIPNVRWVPTYNLALGVQHLLNPSVRGWTMQSISPVGSQTNCGSNNFWLYQIGWITLRFNTATRESILFRQFTSSKWLASHRQYLNAKVGKLIDFCGKKHWTHVFSVVCYICAYYVIVLFISIPSHPIRYPTTSFFSRSQWPAPRSTASSRHPLAPPQQ